MTELKLTIEVEDVPAASFLLGEIKRLVASMQEEGNMAKEVGIFKDVEISEDFV